MTSSSVSTPADQATACIVLGPMTLTETWSASLWPSQKAHAPTTC